MSEAQDAVDTYMAERQAEKEKLDAACAEICEVFRKHFPLERGNLNAPIALAACAELFPCDDALEVRQLYVEWMLEHFVGRKVKGNLEGFEKLYDSLVEGGYDGGEPHTYNDADNDLFYIPHETAKIIALTTQTRNYLYLSEDRRFHIRRFYDEYIPGEGMHEWPQDDVRTRKDCILRALAFSDALLGFSDCVPNCQYPQRPSLQYFKDRDFSLTYKDSRDLGYVATYNDFLNPQVDWAIHNYTEISSAFFYLRYAFEEAEQGFRGC